MLAFVLVAFAQQLGVLGIISSKGLECGVRDAASEQFGGCAEEAVAADDAMVEEAEWPAGGVGFEPEADFAQLDGHRVDVDAVKASTDDVA